MFLIVQLCPWGIAAQVYIALPRRPFCCGTSSYRPCRKWSAMAAISTPSSNHSDVKSWSHPRPAQVFGDVWWCLDGFGWFWMVLDGFGCLMIFDVGRSFLDLFSGCGHLAGSWEHVELTELTFLEVRRMKTTSFDGLARGMLWTLGEGAWRNNIE